MLNRLWIWTGRVRNAEEPAVSDLVKGLMRVDERTRVAVMVLALGPRLRGRLDLAKCLRLAAVGDLAPEVAELLPGLAGECRDGVSREARLVETLRRLSGQMELNRVSAYRWSAEDRRRLFDAGLSGPPLRRRSAAGAASTMPSGARASSGSGERERTRRGWRSTRWGTGRRTMRKRPAGPASAGSRRTGCRRCLLPAWR